MADLLKDIALEFDQSHRVFSFGEKITGTLIFTPAINLENTAFEVCYQWRTQGLILPYQGKKFPNRLSSEQSWHEGMEYRLPFTFQIDQDQSTVHPHGEKLSWYAWANLVTNGHLDDWAGERTETEFSLGEKAIGGDTIKVLPKQVENYLSGNFSIRDSIFWLIWVSVCLLFISVGLRALTALRGIEPLIFLFGSIIFLVLGLINLWKQLNHLKSRASKFLLGIVRLEFGGEGEIQVSVTVYPRRKIILKTVRLTLLIRREWKDIYFHGFEMRFNTNTVPIYSFSHQLEVGETIEPGRHWTGSLAIPIYKDLPVSDGYLGVKGPKIEWQADVEIQEASGYTWRKKTTLQVTKARSSAL